MPLPDVSGRWGGRPGFLHDVPTVWREGPWQLTAQVAEKGTSKEVTFGHSPSRRPRMRSQIVITTDLRKLIRAGRIFYWQRFWGCGCGRALEPDLSQVETGAVLSGDPSRPRQHLNAPEL